MAADNLAVPPGVMVALKKANLHSIPSILEYSNGDLVRRTGLNETQVKGIVEIASETVLSHFEPQTAYEMYRKAQNRLTTGCPLLDQYLEGGFIPKILMEIAGTSGSGKSQLCLQLSLSAQLPHHCGGYAGRTVYVSTECAFPTVRLKELATTIVQKHRHDQLKVKDLMDGVLIHHCATVQALKVLLNFELHSLLKQSTDVKLLIIDSLAALFRVEYNSDEQSERTSDIKSIGTSLHTLINQYGLTVICVNQMTANFTTGSAQPALGLLWSHMINMRLVLARDESVDNKAQYSPHMIPVPRCMSIAFAPHLSAKSIFYYIDNEGLHGLDDIDSQMLHHFY